MSLLMPAGRSSCAAATSDQHIAGSTERHQVLFATARSPEDACWGSCRTWKSYEHAAVQPQDRTGCNLERRDGDMILGADGHIQMDEALLVQLLQRLLVQVCHPAVPRLDSLLTRLQLLCTQCSVLLLTCSHKAHGACCLSRRC